jgi:hypothetical protein
MLWRLRLRLWRCLPRLLHSLPLLWLMLLLPPPTLCLRYCLR